MFAGYLVNQTQDYCPKPNVILRSPGRSAVAFGGSGWNAQSAITSFPRTLSFAPLAARGCPCRVRYAVRPIRRLHVFAASAGRALQGSPTWLSKQIHAHLDRMPPPVPSVVS